MSMSTTMNNGGQHNIVQACYERYYSCTAGSPFLAVYMSISCPKTFKALQKFKGLGSRKVANINVDPAELKFSQFSMYMYSISAFFSGINFPVYDNLF